MKRILGISMAVTLALSIGACGNKDIEVAQTTPETTETVVESTTEIETVETIVETETAETEVSESENLPENTNSEITADETGDFMNDIVKIYNEDGSYNPEFIEYMAGHKFFDNCTFEQVERFTDWFGKTTFQQSEFTYNDIEDIFENFIYKLFGDYMLDSTHVPFEVINGTETSSQPPLQYTYTDMDATMYALQAVNVRDLPSTDGNKIGGLSTNNAVTVTGQCNETGWYRILYSDSVSYVSNKYLGAEKVAVETTQQQANNNTIDPSKMSREEFLNYIKETDPSLYDYYIDYFEEADKWVEGQSSSDGGGHHDVSHLGDVHIGSAG